MEGPTPVSALIHAATMVAAGVFLMARIYPLLAADPFQDFAHIVGTRAFIFPNTALRVMTWAGAITAVYAAVIAVAQWDIKRILAYSTVSQLGYMMMGLGVGGPAVGMFHLITHAFFKALLFMGAGSVIHGCSGEQHIARMGGLRRFMPITFATYAVGMLALSGFPIFFSGFWSKDAILHSAHEWSLSQVPFLLGSIGALLTAFYMTRQINYVFAGELRLRNPEKEAHPEQDVPHDGHAQHGHAHESPSVMTTPLVVLAACTLVLGYFGTPAWPWFQAFLNGEHASFSFEGFHEPGLLTVMFASSVIALTGLFLGWLLYGRKPLGDADPLEQAQPGLFAFVHNAFHVDAFYSATIVRLNTLLSRVSDLFDRYVFNGIVQLVSWTVLGIAHFDRLFDAAIVNPSFDAGTGVVSLSGRMLALFQTGRAQTYLRFIGVALIALLALLLWGAR
jgi:NADH-quinone oxidoreductase subunit L